MMRIVKPSPAMAVSGLALLISLGVAARAANTVGSTDIIDGQVMTVDLANNAVNSGKVLDNSLTLADVAGVNITGAISLSGIPNGRCTQVTFNIGGALVGDTPVVTTRAAIQNGIILYGMRVATAGHVEVSACNFSGVAMNPISNFPVRVITFR